MAKKKRSKKYGKTTLLVILSLFVVIIGIFYVDSNTRLVTSEYVLYYNSLPAEFNGYRIVVLADLHGVEHGENNEKLINAVVDADPAIIVINGDLIDRYQPAKPANRQLEIAEALIKDLSAATSATIYYVTGNHEWDSSIMPELLEMLENSDANVLRNRVKSVHPYGNESVHWDGEEILLIGIDDPNGPADMITPENLFERDVYQLTGDRFIIVLYHRNNGLERFSRLGADLVLSGHGHGGMIRLPLTDGLFGPNNDFLPSYTSGVYTTGNTNMVVSRGLGNHFGWTRFLNNPEVVVVELRVA